MAGGRFLVPQYEAPGHCLSSRSTVKAQAEHDPGIHTKKQQASQISALPQPVQAFQRAAYWP